MQWPWKSNKNLESKEQKPATLQEGELNTSEERVIPDESVVAPIETNTRRPRTFDFVNGTHWLDDLITEHENQGGFDNLPGKGKPLNIDPNEDALAGVLKNSGAVPAWLALQHEIRDDIQRAISSMESQPKFNLENAIRDINVKIRKFNVQSPTPLLQKKLISRENIVRQYEEWQ